ncbi:MULTISPECIES: L-aspartate--glyoxylate aminotransferase BhcA [Mameliella]|uniref:Serine--glyoxylate aminotransferase n=1 Tax=Mameliella alba TaxID=561184 RepID=A0A0B3RS93_9RHOB|nr:MULTISPECIES: L-aspartate--glyoxylate aminotransferase BhcA [Mameliella]KHQ50822.1 Serine--glyoxylate aminotransferase [Mameliella alba]MCR9276125.1 aminotransferase class V-fold PLP-dependent enzyme [Paracoccaceae bacterium]OWV51654.1 serine--glyoxylate aminotransferase [Mameliella alba]
MTDQNPVFIPGPTNMPDRLRRAIQIQTRDHRAPDFVDTFAPVLEDTKKVFGSTEGKIITFPASGTGGWEAAVTNTLSPGDKILVGRYGVFSNKWIDLCQRHGLDVQIVETPWGEGVPADKFAEILAADTAHEIKAVLTTHNETATGVRSDIAAVRRALDGADHPAMLFVDCVSSLASMPFEFDAWGVDIAVSGSQKGFMLPTGMAILCVSPKALAAIETAGLSRTFFDFRDMMKANATGGFPYTPPLQLIYGLRESLDMLFEEGLENVYARHFRLAEGVRRAVDAWGMKLVAKSPDLYSDTVSAVYVPEGFDSNALTDHAYRAYKVSFGVGLGQLDGKAFRIGHLGSLTDVMVLSGLATIEMAMADLNYPITLGSGVAAAQEYYRTSRVAALKSAA